MVFSHINNHLVLTRQGLAQALSNYIVLFHFFPLMCCLNLALLKGVFVSWDFGGEGREGKGLKSNCDEAPEETDMSQIFLHL